MSDDRLGAPNEKMRLCPSCRMSIPVLAVKCRFCGEEVGRPRDESRKLSISDLGGQDATMYAPSSSVMEALEAFRTEEFDSTPPVEAPKRGFFGKKKAPVETPRPVHSGDMPELDENSQALASLSMPTRPRAKSYAPPEPTWMKKISYLGAFIAAILILYFGGIKVVAVINDWRKPPPAALIPNHARDLIEQAKAGDPIKFGDALAEAVNVSSQQPTPSNEEILKKTREEVIAQVNSLLNAKDWTKDKLDKASGIMAKVTTDSDKLIRDLDAERFQELTDYVNTKFKEAKQDTAIFLVKPWGAKAGDPSETREVKVGDVLNDRFKVVDIKPTSVRVEDQKRNDRQLMFKKGENILRSQ